jgi:hypothetical protein
MKRKSIIFSVLLVVITLGSCRQLKELSSFANCEFRLGSVQNTSLAGVNVQQVRSLSDLNLLQAGKITAAYASGSLPLSLTLNVDVKNPNATQAAMNSMDWILLIDGKEIVDGTVNDRIAITPNGGVATLPIQIRADLRKILAKNSTEENINMGLGLAGNGNKPSPKLTLKVKPSFLIGGSSIKYPGYINVNTNFGSSTSSN